MLIEGWLFAFGKLLFFFFDWLAFLIVLNNFFHKRVLGIFVSAWEAIKNVASIATVILAKFELENCPE